MVREDINDILVIFYCLNYKLQNLTPIHPCISYIHIVVVCEYLRKFHTLNQKHTVRSQGGIDIIITEQE